MARRKAWAVGDYVVSTDSTRGPQVWGRVLDTIPPWYLRIDCLGYIGQGGRLVTYAADGRAHEFYLDPRQARALTRAERASSPQEGRA